MLVPIMASVAEENGDTLVVVGIKAVNLLQGTKEHEGRQAGSGFEKLYLPGLHIIDAPNELASPSPRPIK